MKDIGNVLYISLVALMSILLDRNHPSYRLSALEAISRASEKSRTSDDDEMNLESGVENPNAVSIYRAKFR